MPTDDVRGMRRKHGELGQAIVLFVLALALFLLGAIAFSIDMGTIWHHRQSAQNAADAACVAGAMDMLVGVQGGGTGNAGFTPGTALTCAAGSTAMPCKYATLNGYASDGTNNVVSFDFPSSTIVPGIPSSSVPPSSMVPNAFMRVIVQDNVPTYFAGMLNGKRRQMIRASAACGTVLAIAPIPILVMDPHNPSGGSALDVQGNPNITIVGGPTRSIQVNSDSLSAVNVGGSAVIDLSQGGPIPAGGTVGTGSDIGIWGGPINAPAIPKNFKPGTTGHWNPHSAKIVDPFAQVVAPVKPGAPTPKKSVAAGVDGCPINNGSNCDEYFPGDYPTGIQVKNVTAIFQEGVYFVEGDFTAVANSCLRPGTVAQPAPNHIGGTVFYFTGTGVVNVDANSGSPKPNGCPTTGGFNSATGTGVYANGVKCTAGSTIPNNLPAALTGNVLLAPCTGPYGDALVAATGSPDPTIGVQRGLLFFMDRKLTGKNPSWGGGGQFLLAGTMYFHSCNASGTGLGCGATPTYFSDQFTLQGGSGSTTYVLGDIVVDNLALGGNSGIVMDLNPAVAFSQLKASLLR